MHNEGVFTEMKTLGAKFLLAVAVLAVGFSGFILYRAWASSETNIDNLIDKQTRLALGFSTAIRKYIVQRARPVAVSKFGKDDFVPELMSGTFVTGSVFERVRKEFPEYIIKFSTPDPRNPNHLAGPDEMKIFNYFKENPQAKLWVGKINMNGSEYLARFIPRRMAKGCLRCHGNPDDAPKALLKRYGRTASFNKRIGEVIAMDTIAIPTAQACTMQTAEVKKQIIVISVSLILLFGAIIFMFRFLVTRRLAKITGHFKQFTESGDIKNLAPIDVRSKDEIGVLAGGFNAMVSKLSEFYASLENRVTQRTKELAETNEELQNEITERQNAQEEKSKLDHRQQVILENISAYVFLKDIDGRYTAVNHLYHDMLPDGVDDPIAKRSSDIYSGQSAKIYKDEEQQVLKEGKTITKEETVKLRDGRVIHVVVTLSPVRTDGGKIVGMVGIAYDITERKLGEKELKESMDKLQKFNQLAIGREKRMIELKREVNEVANKAGEKSPYDMAFAE